MNRVLSWPLTPIFPGLLESLKGEKLKTAVTGHGTIRFDLFLGPVEMKFSNHDQQLPAGTEVIVWWKGGGFVCAIPDEIVCEEEESRSIAERVIEARIHLAEARAERQARLLNDLDIVLPAEVEPQHQAAA
jgi:hypothetical protein